MNTMHRLILILLLTLRTLPALAIEPSELPKVLQDWQAWVLAEKPHSRCPFFLANFQQKQCIWPGSLKLTLQDRQGLFSGDWTLYQTDWLTLPGDTQHWPQQVSVNQKPAIVIEHLGKPAIRLPAGHYQLSGQFFWDKLPDSLALAEINGLLNVTVNGVLVEQPRIDQGSLWLNTPALSAQPQANHLDLQVFRQIIDDNPLQVITRLELNVAGAAREISLPHALLSDFMPIRLDSPLPARLENDGQLRLQVRPGRWTISLHARHPNPLTRLDFAVQDPQWPASELWAFQAMPALRLVELENLPSVDPSQTNLPAEWQHLPTYLAKQGDSLQFKVLRQGDPEPEPNQLSLKRTLWLDFAGTGYSVSDQINGKMSRDWRLDTLPELHLGQALLNGQNQLITHLGAAGQGIEVRRGELQLQADSRIESAIDHINAVGWQPAFQHAQAELNLPPGWRLLAVSGVDNQPDSWLNRWTLLDLFLVLIISLAMHRLWSWHWGLLALFSLALFWHEAEAPRWIWLHTLAALALVRVMPENRFSCWVKAYRNLCWLGLLLIVVPFMIEQIRIGLYPQLERPWQPIEAPVPYAAGIAGQDEMAAGISQQAPAAPTPRALKQMAETYTAIADYASSTRPIDRIDPEANLQTGPGLPQWQWQTVHLSWNGAVDSQQAIRLWYVSPGWNLLLHVLQACLTAILCLKLIERWPIAGLQLPKFKLTAWLLLVFLCTPSQDSLADIPEPALLEQLKNRLLEPPACLPSCAQIPYMQIHSQPDSLKIQLTIHVQEALAVPLPAQRQQWFPQQISVDGQTAPALLQTGDGALWLNLNAGVHQVVLQGRPGPQYKFTLPLPLLPQHTQISSEGWRVDGLYENGKTGPQLEFSRLQNLSESAAQNLSPTSLPAFVQIQRTLQLGMDWQLQTRIVKLAGNDSPLVLELPLLAGEAVTSPHMRIKDDKVQINLPAGQTSLEWQSLLEKREHLTLTAPENTIWNELWRADISPMWHVNIEGIAVVHHQDPQGSWLPEWRPWPGETVSLHISRPPAVPGPTLTIDKSQLRVQPGQRSQLTDLTLTLRSSKGGQHHLTLPPQAVLQTVSIDGVSQPIRQKAQTVTLPIRPGSQQVHLNWQTPIAQSPILTTPTVDLGIPSVNSHLQVQAGADRWVLLTLGPRFGPAALIWGLLAVLTILAFGLGQTRLTPLKTWHWLLLLIGLSQLHIAAGVLIVCWLFALGWRQRTPPASLAYFNLTQIGLGLLTCASVWLLFAAVQQGLLGTPDMQITGNQSSAQNLNWYQDHSAGVLPTATVFSLPMLAYRVLMLGWSLWMALALLDWLRWGWLCFSNGGVYIKAKAKPAPVLKADDSHE